MAKKKSASDPTFDTISKEWSDRIRRMKEYQREHATSWNTNEALLTGDTTGVEAEGIAKGVGNRAKGHAYAWGLVRALISEIYAQNPQVLAEPYSQELYQHARLVTRICQSELDEMDAEDVLQMAIQDTFPCGLGVVIEACDNYVSVASDPQTNEKLPVLKGQDFGLRRIHPGDFFPDPAGRLHDLSDHRYVMLRFYPTIGWLKQKAADERAKGNTWVLPDKLDEAPESVPGPKSEYQLQPNQSSIGTGMHQESEPDYRQVAVLEIHDKTSFKIIYVLEHNLFQMAEIPWPIRLAIKGKDFYPITLVVFNKKSTGFFPVPEITLVRPQLLELANLSRMMREDAANKIRKMATMAEFVDPLQKGEIADQTKTQNIIAFDRKAVEEFFGQDNVPRDFDIRRLFAMVDDFQINRDHPARYQMVQAEIEHILGYGPSNRGGIPQVRSAREAMIINDSNQGKLQTKIGQVERAFRQIAQKHIMFLQQLAETERYARNFPEVAQLQPFFSYTKDQVKGEFAFRIFGGSSKPRNTDARKAQVREMFQLMAPLLQQQGYDLRPLVEMVAKAHGWDEVDMVYKNIRQELLALAATSFALQSGQGQQQQLLEAVARVVQTGLTQAELQTLASKVAPQGGAPPGTVPSEKPPMAAGDPDPMGTAEGMM